MGGGWFGLAFACSWPWGCASEPVVHCLLGDIEVSSGGLACVELDAVDDAWSGVDVFGSFFGIGHFLACFCGDGVAASGF